MYRNKFLPLLQSVCTANTKDVFSMAKQLGFSEFGKRGRKYVFKPGFSPTSPLVVCHADTVVKGGDGPHPFAYDKASDTVNSIALDDRLGVACMFDAIQNKRGHLSKCAFLICDDEEIGQSTAQVFDRDIAPNFLVELDRRGTDVVCYEYESVLFSSLLTSVGFRVGQGSFSDICYLGEYGVCGFNVGIGYHNEHSDKCHAKLSDTQSQIAILERFLSRFWSLRLDWEDTSYRSRPLRNDPYCTGNGSFIDDDFEYDDEYELWYNKTYKQNSADKLNFDDFPNF
jgi:hypothetical protein